MGRDLVRHNVESRRMEALDERAPRAVVTSAAGNPVGDGEHLGLKREHAS